ncbi:efflux RND transporter permease subunit [Halosquirtibacter laminarini]|uniref:Efflux RND transporter permease subunit n=1 Tax=Halosquirtibacter laminarini TaxID=3374600 RepID=A0AC61NHK1_9BACT|nr:efflux RND transporter permease subunit [Prolixibacteraceae bacterium]
MSLTKYAIEKNRITFTMLLVIIVMGLQIYKSLPRDSMPPYTVRVATIVSQFPGASPERVEQLVTDKVEKKVQEIPEMKEISSTSRTGLSVVTIKLYDKVTPEKLQAVWDKVRRKLDEIDDLPDNVQPRLKDDDVGVVYGIMVGVISDGFSYKEMKDCADALKDKLIKLDDAARVELGGTQDERIFVSYDEAKLQEYGLTSSKLQSMISNTNILNSGGMVEMNQERIILEPTGNFNSVDDIRNLLIPVGSKGQVVMLKDIAEVSAGYVEPASSLVRVDGKKALSLSVSLKEGANIIQLGEEVDRVVNKWNEHLPYGLEVKRLASMDTYVDKSIKNFISNLIQSIVIVLLVMLLFLGFRTGVVVASLIPIVTIMTLLIMGLMGVGLNQVTLAALIMALGMMVDNAIVVSESIMVRMDQGESAKDAAIASCKELAIPLFISTLTTSVAFLSFFLADSVMGDIMGPIFVVITIALLSSWLIAMTITAMFCALFLKVKKASKEEESQKRPFVDRIFDRITDFYKQYIVKLLPRKGLVVTVVILLFFVSIWAFRFIPFTFFPDSDRNMITIDINLPLGTKVERTSEVVSLIEQYMNDSLLVSEDRKEGVVDFSSFIGQGPFSYDLGYSQDEANSSYAHMLVNTTSFEVNQKMINKLDAFGFIHFPNADIRVGFLKGGGGGTPIEIKVQGDNPDILAELSESIKLKLTQVNGTKNVKDDWGPKSKKLVIDIDQNKARMAQITNQDIATSLRTVLDGFKTGDYREDDKSIPILLRHEGSQKIDFEKLKNINVYSQTSGKSIPLSQVAQIVPLWQYNKYLRLDLVRSINVSSELNSDGNAASIMKTMVPWLEKEKKSWPEGYRYELGGDSENTAENMAAVFKYLPLTAFLILLLLVIQFNSYKKMILVVSTIPLGVIGVVFGLIVFRSYFGFMAFLGMISLAGIVINNAIVLIDRIEIEMSENGKSRKQAVIDAGVQRLRPILLTTFTTSLGLIPLYLGGGLIWEPMAISLMIGLLFGTMITLVFIPSLYALFYRIKY